MVTPTTTTPTLSHTSAVASDLSTTNNCHNNNIHYNNSTKNNCITASVGGTSSSTSSNRNTSSISSSISVPQQLPKPVPSTATTTTTTPIATSATVTSTATTTTSTTLDFIGNSVSVKDLFALPYAYDRPIAVAVHNLGGTLLIDTANPQHLYHHYDPPPSTTTIWNTSSHDNPRQYSKTLPPPHESFLQISSPLSILPNDDITTTTTTTSPRVDHPNQSHNVQKPNSKIDDTEWNTDTEIPSSRTSSISRSLVAMNINHSNHNNINHLFQAQNVVEPVSTFLNSIMMTPPPTTTSTSSSELLYHPLTSSPTTTTTATASNTDADTLLQQHDTSLLSTNFATTTAAVTTTTTPADDCAAQYIPPVQDPREYLSWNFRGMNLLVGSDTVIYRTTGSTSTASSSTGNNDSIATSSNTTPSITTTPANGLLPMTDHSTVGDASNNNTNATTDVLRSTTSSAANGTSSIEPAVGREIVTSSSTNDVPTNPSKTLNAIVVRVEDVNQMQSMLRQHVTMKQSGNYIADHQLNKLQQVGKLSYADVAASKDVATATSRSRHRRHDQTKQQQQQQSSSSDDTISNDVGVHTPSSTSFVAPDLDRVQLQTCIVPVPSVNETSSVEGYLSYMQQHQRSMTQHRGSRCDSVVSHSESQQETVDSTTAADHPVATPNTSQPLNPVSTVLDTYLDNIMANVPQLALCLREKGFIQSVKLLNTEEIPSRFLLASTFNTSVPFETIQGGPGDPADEAFSPQIMEMNAQALLRFLKTNCMKDNATYLLRRDVGHTNLQLYDISSISAQRQQKWIWWLAMISYRFSNRLKHLSQNIDTSDPGLRRSFRVRQRSLLHNTLDMLETLADMNGNKHESLIAAVCENLADTYLVIGSGDPDNVESNVSGVQATNTSCPIEPPPEAVSSHQPYGNISVDALGKAQDHLAYGIKMLTTVLHKTMKPDRIRKTSSRRKGQTVANQSVKSGFLSDASDSEEDDHDDVDDAGLVTCDDERIDPVAIQLFGMHQKIVNVSLRLAEIHLKNYWSSSAMQNLRSAGQRVSDSLYLAKLVDHNKGTDAQNWLPKIEVQYAWLWEQCGHFARSFAADVHWRDRGHASGDDVVSVLQDVDAAFSNRAELNDGPLNLHRFSKPLDTITIHSNRAIGLHSLSGVLDFHRPNSKLKVNDTNELKQKSYLGAIQRLENQKMLQRDERRVLVVAALAYSRAVYMFDEFPTSLTNMFDTILIDFLRQRLGDACNEIGKVMLNEVRSLLTGTKENDMSICIAEALCSSAEFWFLEGLHLFQICGDLRNLALLRCNLCQCYKFRANAMFAQPNSNNHHQCTDQDHAESCLQEATNQLQAAHVALEIRDTDPLTWDMVSGELAATLLVLGVRRRQSLIGSGNTMMILQALRLAPGKERSIVDPMLRALSIYEETGKIGQAAAAHYQLAQLYAKIWTCQRDESKTREKLAAAFKHYEAAHSYYVQTVRSNEATFCLLCLDLASLFASVPGEQGLSKALCCCLDTRVCFSSVSIDAALSDLTHREEWFTKLDTLANTVDERLFKVLKSLVKIKDDTNCDQGRAVASVEKYKNMYRAGLTAKMTFATNHPNIPQTGDIVLDAIIKRLCTIHHIIDNIKTFH